MSYRAFKRLLGESSLERKCRFLFGAFILVLTSGSFYLYARQTEHLAYEQMATTCRLLIIQIMDRKLRTVCKPRPTVPRAWMWPGPWEWPAATARPHSERSAFSKVFPAIRRSP